MPNNSYNAFVRFNRTKLLVIFGALVIIVILILVMGFLTNLFSKKVNVEPAIASKSAPPHHQEAWAPYLSTIDGNKVGSILVDLGLKEIAPIKDKTNLLRVSIKIVHPTENGMASMEEAETLNDIVERLNDVLVAKYGAIFAGRLNSGGEFVSYHYLGDSSGYEKTVSDVMFASPQYKFDFLLREEKEWETYSEFLYPEPIQLQSIKNSFGLQNLMREGDKLENERDVDHWIYFKTDAGREKFIAKLKGQEFDVLGKDTVEAQDAHPFQLHISRKDKVDPGSIDKYVLPLWQLAQDCDGYYDGWETSFVKD